MGGENAVDPRLVGALRVLLAPAQESVHGISISDLCDSRKQVVTAIDAAVSRTAMGKR